VTSLLCAIVDLNLETVSSCVADGLKGDAAAPRCDCARCCPIGVEVLCRFSTLECRAWLLAFKPGEDRVERVPELGKRREWPWELVAEHVLPLQLDLIDVLRCANGVCVWDGDAGMCALLCEYAHNLRSEAEDVWVAMYVYDVVEVARTATLGERARLLCRELRE
jgi:hypothetical protein